ncbi:MurR/RpiR family transcriptional regulator [Terrilactibacillus sp. S3-3]|nr:MurR/RpiR family transcriptional regulator [Terrilactibacillus sp. S3-3]
MSGDVYDEKERGIHEVFQDDMNNIQATLEKLDTDAFYKTVNALLNAKKIYIIANRSAVSLGIFLQYYLHMMLDNVELLQSIENNAEKLYNLSQDDVVVAISFSRYTNATIKMFAFAKKSKALTIAITDHLLSPLIPYADISLTASSRMPTFIDSFVAPLSLINALITFIGKKKKEAFYDRLEALEKTWRQFNIFN